MKLKNIIAIATLIGLMVFDTSCSNDNKMNTAELKCYNSLKTTNFESGVLNYYNVYKFFNYVINNDFLNYKNRDYEVNYNNLPTVQKDFLKNGTFNTNYYTLSKMVVDNFTESQKMNCKTLSDSKQRELGIDVIMDYYGNKNIESFERSFLRKNNHD